MTKSCLTRYLYEKHEVELSFIHSMLEQKDLHACYFWITELYFSKISCISIFVKLFYYFYFSLNKNLERYFVKVLLQISYESNNTKQDIQYILSLTKNLFYKNHNPLPLFQKNIVSSKLTFRGRKPKWINETVTEFHDIFMHISKCALPVWEKYESLSDDNLHLFYSQLKLTKSKISFSENCLCLIDSLLDNKNFLLCKELYFALHFDFVYFNDLFKQGLKNDKLFVVKIEENEIDKILEWDDLSLVEKDPWGNCRVYKTLPTKRIYSIHRFNNLFTFPRKQTSDFMYTYYYHWESLAYNCDLWKQRFDKYNVSFNEKKIVFPDDDKLEEFYSYYNFEPDEQSNKVNNMAFSEIVHEPDCVYYCRFENINVLEWIDYFYKDNQSNDLLKFLDNANYIGKDIIL